MLFAGGFAYEKLVFRRASGVWTGVDDQLAVVSKDAFPAAQGVFDEFSRRQIFIDARGFKWLRNSKRGSTPRQGRKRDTA